MLKSWWMCRCLPPPGRHHFGCPHGRYLQIFEIHWFFKYKCKKLNFWNPRGCVDFCRLRDGIISGASMAGTFRFLKFIGFNSKHAQSWNCKILMDVSNCAASGTASFPVPAWPVPSDFWNSMIFQKNCKKLKVWNPDGCVELCRLREGIILGPRMAGPSDLLKFIDFSKNHLFCNDFCNYIDVNIGGAAQTSWPYTP